MKEKVELFPADLNNRVHICFRLLLELYHTGNAFRQNDVVCKTGASRSEVSKCVIGMIEDGLLEQVGIRKKLLRFVCAAVLREHAESAANGKLYDTGESGLAFLVGNSTFCR